VRLATAARASAATRAPLRSAPRQPQAISAIRFIAASLLLAGLGLLIGGTMLSPHGLVHLARLPGTLAPAPVPESVADGLTDAKGLLTLASLKLPTACLPLSHRPISAEQAAEIASAIANGSLEGLRCCTECHRAGLSHPKAPQLVAIAQQNCQTCHRG
jgi:hypothetical protein